MSKTMLQYDELYPLPSTEKLEKLYVGKNLRDVPTPAAVIDRSTVQRNCKQLLDAGDHLQLGLRPHVKSHKTVEITELQVGVSSAQVNIVVSTIIEAEHLLEYLDRCQCQGRDVNVLYGVPLPPSQIHRLARLGKTLGPRSISVLIDHPSQLEILSTFKDEAGFSIELFIKVDTGYHRAGLTTISAEFHQLLKIILDDVEPKGYAKLRGFYSHAGHSYAGDSSSTAMNLLRSEIEGLEYAANLAIQNSNSNKEKPAQRYVLSVGATPTATSVQNLTRELSKTEPELDEEMAKLKACVERVILSHFVELHAGVYPILDMQQVATQASPSASKDSSSKLGTGDIALTILAEVASVYSKRDSPEALVAAGSLALGREPCKSYNGWGIVSDWGMDFHVDERRSGWQVGRINQQHGILTKDPNSIHDPTELQVGQKILILPNDASMAGACFGWYLVVDSGLPDESKDEVVAVWVRWRGW